MKWDRLETGTMNLGDGVRVRLARRADAAFLEQVSDMAGVGRSADRLTDPDYQAGIRAAISRAGTFYPTVGKIYNRQVESKAGHALTAAISAATYDLVATVDGRPVGAVHMGPSQAVIGSLMNNPNVDEHQCLGLIFGSSKMIALGVLHEERGHGYGARLTKFAMEAADRCGVSLIWSDCLDSPSLLNFYQSCGFRILPPGGWFNVWPIAGPHVARIPSSSPNDGPFINTEPGYRMIGRLTKKVNNDTTKMLADLNPALAK